MSTKFFLNFYGVSVCIETEWSEIRTRLEKDFSYFLTHKQVTQDLHLIIKNDSIKFHYEDDIFSYKSSKVSFFEKDNLRICSYKNKVESEVNFESGQALVRGHDLNAVHEVSYLLTLSRVGKALDLRGFHRVHGASWIKNSTLYIALLPSGGGKSTLLANLIQDKNISFVSDDSPLVNSEGEVFPFPMRVGFSSSDPTPPLFEGVDHYELERFRFGAKRLFSLKDLQWKIGGEYKDVVLLTGHKGQVASFKRSFGLSHLRQLFIEGVIGFGLPILYEYFWEYGWRDFARKSTITIKRVYSLLKLWFKSKKYHLTISSEPGETVTMLKKLMEEN